LKTSPDRFCLTLALLVLLAAPAGAGDRELAEQSFSFANHLLVEGEYYRAVTEYRRTLYWAPDGARELRARSVLGVGQALHAGGEFTRASEWLVRERDQIEDPALRAEALRLMSRGFLVDNHGLRLQQVLEEVDPGWPERDFYRGLALARSAEWARAETVFGSIPGDSPNGAFAAHNALASHAAAERGRKSPTVGGVLGLVPGLGYLYSGHAQSALSTLVVVGLGTWATIEAFDSGNDVLGGVLTAITITWYGSSIYGSARAANRYNAALERDLFDSLRW
jgi:hypothetical protein